MKFKSVLVSPMRRCQQTAYHLLKDHPEFQNIQFVLVLYCREHLHTSGDVPLPYSDQVSLAQELFPKVDVESCFTQYDESVRETYFLEDLDEEPRQKI